MEQMWSIIVSFWEDMDIGFRHLVVAVIGGRLLIYYCEEASSFGLLRKCVTVVVGIAYICMFLGACSGYFLTSEGISWKIILPFAVVYVIILIAVRDDDFWRKLFLLASGILFFVGCTWIVKQWATEFFRPYCYLIGNWDVLIRLFVSQMRVLIGYEEQLAAAS